jgi:hypothetical protein
MYTVAKKTYRNATHYESGKPATHIATLATSLTFYGAAVQYRQLRDEYEHWSRFREGDQWFSYRFMGLIIHVEIVKP